MIAGASKKKTDVSMSFISVRGYPAVDASGERRDRTTNSWFQNQHFLLASLHYGGKYICWIFLYPEN